jgi:hypothetical protein
MAGIDPDRYNLPHFWKISSILYVIFHKNISYKKGSPPPAKKAKNFLSKNIQTAGLSGTGNNNQTMKLYLPF